MSKKTTTKPASSTQVRLSPELAREIDIRIGKFPAKISRAAYVEMMIKRGIKFTDELNEPQFCVTESK